MTFSSGFLSRERATSRPGHVGRAYRLGGASMALLGLALSGHAFAQPNGAQLETVSWSVTAPAGTIKPDARVSLTVHGAVTNGWHVYGLKQAPDGPTPLVVIVEPSPVAKVDGGPTASRAAKAHDPSFDLDTEFYAKPFTVTVPVRLGAALGVGLQQIPLSIRFQTCNGRVCQPPKTVRLSAALTVGTGG